MAWHNDYGKRGEEKVYRYLLDKGYTVLERNWRIGHKEVDFVVLDGEILVIVEVKTRSVAEEYPEEILSYRKKKNLLLAGAAYLNKHHMKRELRFDLVLVTGPTMLVEHIPDAISLW